MGGAGSANRDESSAPAQGKGSDKSGDIEYPAEEISPDDIPF